MRSKGSIPAPASACTGSATRVLARRARRTSRGIKPCLPCTTPLYVYTRDRLTPGRRRSNHGRMVSNQASFFARGHLPRLPRLPDEKELDDPDVPLVVAADGSVLLAASSSKDVLSKLAKRDRGAERQKKGKGKASRSADNDHDNGNDDEPVTERSRKGKSKSNDVIRRVDEDEDEDENDNERAERARNSNTYTTRDDYETDGPGH